LIVRESDVRVIITSQFRIKSMNSKGHLIISFLKSFIRILSCVFAICGNFLVFPIGFLLAEILGVFEELVDKR